MEIFAQIIGLLAGAAAISAFQFRSNRMTFILQMMGALLFCINSLMLNAIAGCILNAVAVVRGIFLCIPEGRGITSTTFWISIGLTLAAFGWQYFAGLMNHWIDVLLMVQFLAGTYFCWRQDGRLMRLGQLCIMSPICLYYNFTFHLIGGVLTEMVNIASIIISILRYGWNGFERADAQKDKRGESCV